MALALLTLALPCSTGPVVLCDGVCQRRRPDVSDSTLEEVRRGTVPLLRRRGHVGFDVPAPTRGHLQVTASTLLWNRFSPTLE